MTANKTVASVSFNSNHNLSMDVDEVQGISMGAPMKVAEGQWFCEMIVRSANGTVVVNMLADDPSKFAFELPDFSGEPKEDI
ncbi:MAG TPA: hypothetical protein VKP60_04950 [Magnetospirillaceae bacterium]|nr:hypothetical protein [Magnetospirillaceae bacterium]